MSRCSDGLKKKNGASLVEEAVDGPHARSIAVEARYIILDERGVVTRCAKEGFLGEFGIIPIELLVEVHPAHDKIFALAVRLASHVAGGQFGLGGEIVVHGRVDADVVRDVDGRRFPGCDCRRTEDMMQRGLEVVPERGQGGGGVRRTLGGIREGGISRAAAAARSTRADTHTSNCRRLTSGVWIWDNLYIHPHLRLLTFVLLDIYCIQGVVVLSGSRCLRPPFFERVLSSRLIWPK